MNYGGHHKLSFEEYHAIPGGWDEASIESAHKALGGKFDIHPTQVPDAYHPWLKYRQILYNIANGVRGNDAACVELAVRFIELHFMGSYAGYVRALLARRLKHAHLTDEQRERLNSHFIGLLQRHEHCHEFRDYLKLWGCISMPADITRVEQLAQANTVHSNDFIKQVLITLRSALSSNRTNERNT